MCADCRVLQYYFNLGVQWYHQSCWQQQQAYPPTAPETPYTYQHYTPYLSQEPPLHGPAPPTEGSFSISSAPAGSAPTSPLLYPDQTPLPPPTMLHLPYEAPPPSTYLSYAPPLPPPPHHHPAHLPHHSSYHPYLPPSTHWGALQTGGHPPRVYCPAPNPAHVVTGGSCIPSAAPDLDWRSTGRTAGGAPAAASHSTKKKKKKKKKSAPAHQTTCSPCEVT
ncbi:hypothetical protein L3Q82_020182 [Scortum barcoo]|uniref:Uncharacterized protein n=1 Tax=Scortum barcoo TaxID=214431 RepID=A0ACB8VAZ9_9TELE|nr:hypothetical protein L3Q82_020182 [Scortum barcoo]